MKEHVKHVSTILSCLNKRDLKLKSRKCEFHKIEMKFLKFVVDQNEIRIDSKKNKVIKEWKFSINVKKLQSFIEFVNYNRNFIKNFLSIAISLFKLTIKNKLWKWKSKREQIFKNIQQTMMKKFILKMFDINKNVKIEIDASNLIIKACFSQKHDDKWHSMTYLSRKFTSTKQNYDIHDKELLTIVATLKTWKVYAKETSKLIILMNHKTLIHFTTIEQLNRRQMRWSKLLDQYKFTIQYISRKNNDKANTLSRRNDHMKDKKVFNHNILKVNKNESLSINQRELSAILKILKNDQKQFSIVKEKLHISKNKIDEIIKKHHNESLQNHSNVFKILQFLRQTYYFFNIQQHVETYIKKCLDCQRNKHSTHVKYDEIQY